jgi:hypothetical protein
MADDWGNGRVRCNDEPDVKVRVLRFLASFGDDMNIDIEDSWICQCQ